MRTSAYLSAAIAAATLAACASRPQPVPEPLSPPPPPTRSAPVTAPPEAPRPLGPVPGSMEDFRVTAGERVFFDTDQHVLRADARATLEKQAAWLKTYPAVRILITGNADERGTREYNLALGARRAQAARDYLVSLGVAPSRINTVSYGKERPVDPRSNEAAWAINRNAHTVLQGLVS